MSSCFLAEDIDIAENRLAELGRKIIPPGIMRLQISEWAEKNRVLTEGFHPGVFTFDVTPFFREIVDSLSPDSPVREVAIMKGSRIGATTAVGENFLGFWIEHGTGNFGYATADADTAGAQMEARIDELINTAGIGHLIGAREADKRKNQKKTGDRTLRKRIPSGYLFAGGPNASYFKRSFGYTAFYGDEIDADAWEIAMKDGDKIYLIRRRLAEFENTYKALWTSSPKKEHNSNILRVYKEGDQRKYFVPCKKCGHMQYLKWSQIKFEHDEDDRLIAEYNADGEIKKSSVHYECEACGAHWKNSDKAWFLPRGEWRPTATPRRPNLRSYHLPSLYAPVGSVSWESGVIDFLQIKHKNFPPLEYQVWINTYLGEPFVEQGLKPRLEAILTRERNYHKGTLPETVKPIFLTLGADVQGGQNSRIECEVVAWLRNKTSYSVNYFVLPGDTEDIDSEAWNALREIIRQEHAGYNISLAAVDAGYNTDVVYKFCDSFERGVFPVMGSNEPVASRKYITIIPGKDGRTVPRVDINTDLLKQEIYQYLGKSIYESGIVPNGYCYFPLEYSRQHYINLTNETRSDVADKNGYIKKQWIRTGRNEQLDCFDCQTEVLTDQGWKFFKDLNKTESLMTINMDTEEIEYQKPTHYISRYHEGEMVKIKGRRLDILVTPKHRMVTVKKIQERQLDGKRKWNLDPPPQITLAKDLTIHHQILTSGKWTIDHKEKIIIPEFISNQGRVVWPSISVNTGDMAEFLGWYVAEGCCFKTESKTQKGSVRRRVQIDQKEGAKSEKIRHLLKKLPWKFNESKNHNCNRWMCTSAQLYEFVQDCGSGVENKKVPEWIKHSSSKVINRFIDSAILGDGWQQQRGNGKVNRTYATISKQLADDMQELFIKIGETANITQRHTPEWHIDGRGNNNCKPQYHVFECKGRKASLDGGERKNRRYIGETVKFSGMVYCATVPNGTLFLRRNGKAFIAGNCRVYNLAMVYTYLQIIEEDLRGNNVIDKDYHLSWDDFWNYLSQ